LTEQLFHHKTNFQHTLKGFLIMKIDQKNIIDKVESGLKACLQRVPFLEIELLEKDLYVADRRIDISVTVRIAGQRKRLAVEIKTNGQPRVARMAVDALALIRASNPEIYGVFSAPYISPQAAEICIKEKMGYLDLAGNCRLAFDQVYIEQSGNPNPFAQKRDLRSLYSPKAARVLRVLLMNPKKSWRLQALAQEAKVSLGQIANVKRLLEDREWLASSTAGLSLSDPESLLAEWSESFDSRKNLSRNYYTLKSISEIEGELSRACENEGIAYALTGFSGAARYAPSVRYQRAMAYVSQNMGKVADMLDLKEVDSGANISLFTPYDEGVLYGAQPIDGISIASPVQVYLDLVGVKGRGEEAATTLLDEVIKRSW
jgi:hypothetical protein